MFSKFITAAALSCSGVHHARTSLEQGPELYKTFRNRKDGCIKVVLKPQEKLCEPAGASRGCRKQAL
jgi:hypothetical protein